MKHTPLTIGVPPRRQWLRRVFGTAAGVALVGCNDPVPALRVGSIVFPTYELAFLAREMGWIEATRVRLIEVPANTFTLRALAAGQLESAQLTLDEVITARAAGIDLTVVLVLDVSAGSDAVYARTRMALADLAGKRIGLEEGATGAVMLGGLLTAAGLRIDQIRKVPTTLNRTAELFKSGEVDAVVTAEPWASQIEQAGGVRLFDSRQIPNRIIDVLAVRNDALKLHGAAVRELVGGILSARRHQLADAADASAKMAPRLQIAPGDVGDAFRGLDIPTLEQNRQMLRADGLIVQSARSLQQVMLAIGLLREAAAPEVLVKGLVDEDFLPDRAVA